MLRQILVAGAFAVLATHGGTAVASTGYQPVVETDLVKQTRLIGDGGRAVAGEWVSPDPEAAAEPSAVDPDAITVANSDPATRMSERPSWLPTGADADRVLDQLPAPRAFASPRHSLFFGAPAPLALGEAVANVGDPNSPYRTCAFELASDTPGAYRGDFRTISYGLSVDCQTGYVTGTGFAHLHEAVSNARLATTPAFGIGQGIRYSFSNYTRSSDTQMVWVEGYFEMNINSSSASAGWAPPAFAGAGIECTGALTKTLKCWFATTVFPFVPDRMDRCETGPICDAANGALGQAQRLVAQLTAPDTVQGTVSPGCGIPATRVQQSVPGLANANTPRPPVAIPAMPDPDGQVDGAAGTAHQTALVVPIDETPGAPSVDGVCDESDVGASAADHTSYDCQHSGRVYAPEYVATNKLRGTAAPYCARAGWAVTATHRVCLMRLFITASDKTAWNTLYPCRSKSYNEIGMRDMTLSKTLPCRKTLFYRRYRTWSILTVHATGPRKTERGSPYADVKCTV